MRRPSRQIEVFDISLMAVVTKAMGAFLVLFVLVLPFYTGDPQVDATAKDAREQLAQMKRELDNLARQVGASPQDVEALRNAVQRMQGMADDGAVKIDQLSKQADALSSQLRRAREERDRAKDEAAAAEALSKQARTAEAEIEVVANRLARERREALIAEAQGERNENELLSTARSAAFPPKKLVLYVWSWKPDCPKDGVALVLRTIGDAKVPDGVDLKFLGGLGESMVRRSDNLNGQMPLGTPTAGQPRRAFSIATLWRSEDERGLTIAHIEHPSATACRFDLTTTVVDVDTHFPTTLEQHNLELPASAQYVLLNGLDFSKSSARVSAPTDDDQSLWNDRKSDMPRFCSEWRC